MYHKKIPYIIRKSHKNPFAQSKRVSRKHITQSFFVIERRSKRTRQSRKDENSRSLENFIGMIIITRKKKKEFIEKRIENNQKKTKQTKSNNHIMTEKNPISKKIMTI